MNVAGNSAENATNAGRDLVFGLGASGLSIARFLHQHGIAADYFDTRTEPPGLDELRELNPGGLIVLGQQNEALLERRSRIICSPGVPDDEPLLVDARDAGIEVISDIELFAAAAEAPFVAVTGSNGKSTVTTLIALMCRASGREALAGANLGEPALDLLAKPKPDFYVLELSSFQLARTPHLPSRVAVLLNISPDHLDWHASEEEYREAKYRIFAQADACVFNREDPDSEARIGEGVPCVSFGLDVPGEDQYGVVSDHGERYLARGEQLLLAVDEVALVGAHNHANALAALAAGELMGLELPAMLQVLHEFPGLPHRMQFVAEVAGVRYINDSKATNVGAAIASVQSVQGPVVLIAGGLGKGGDFEHLAGAIHEHLHAAILIGADAAAIADALDGLTSVHREKDMRTAVRRAAQIAAEGDTVLLAPACASFDQYPNFGKRGEDFCNEVEALPS